MDATDMANVMLDFQHGMDIYERQRGTTSWHLTSSPNWNWEDFEYKSEEPCPNEDHELDCDDSNSAYYLGGQATMEDYAEAAEWDAYDPYADDFDQYY